MANANIVDNDYFYINWSINNFSLCWHLTGEYLSSPSFFAGKNEASAWKLILFPRGIGNDSLISLCLCREKDSFQIKDVDFMIQFLASDGTTLDIRKDNHLHNVIVNRGVITEKKYLPQDTLQLRCRITLDKRISEMKKLSFRTLINTKKVSFLINIENFSNIAPGQPIYFPVKSDSQDVILEINITVASDNEGKLFMDVCTFDKNIKYFKMKIFMLDDKKSNIDSGEYKYNLYSGNRPKFPIELSKSNLMSYKYFYLTNDVLTLKVELEITGIPFNGVDNAICDYTLHPISNVSSKIWRKCVCHQKLSDCPSALITDLISLQIDQNSCDMKIQTKTNTYHVHKLILGARSPVFKAMFSNEMKETINGCVDVSDLDDETMRLFLSYLYTDQLGDLKWEETLKLYTAADKYSVIPLKDKCSTFLKSNLQSQNVCKVLILSYLHNDFELRTTSQNYVLKNAEEILKSEDWKVLVDTHSKLAAETLSRNWIKD